MKVYIATTSFVANGVSVTEGDTVTEGHPLMLGRESLFRPFRPTHTHSVHAPEVSRRASAPHARAPQRKTQRVTRRA